MHTCSSPPPLHDVHTSEPSESMSFQFVQTAMDYSQVLAIHKRQQQMPSQQRPSQTPSAYSSRPLAAAAATPLRGGGCFGAAHSFRPCMRRQATAAALLASAARLALFHLHTHLHTWGGCVQLQQQQQISAKRCFSSANICVSAQEGTQLPERENKPYKVLWRCPYVHPLREGGAPNCSSSSIRAGCCFAIVYMSTLHTQLRAAAAAAVSEPTAALECLDVHPLCEEAHHMVP